MRKVQNSMAQKCKPELERLAALGFTFQEIADITGFHIGLLYNTAKFYGIKVKKPWKMVQEHFNEMYRLRYTEKRTFAEIAAIYGVSDVRIHQLFADRGLTKSIGCRDEHLPVCRDIDDFIARCCREQTKRLPQTTDA